MSSGLRRLIGAAAIAALVAVAHGAPPEAARPGNAAGTSTLWRAGKTTDVTPSAEFREGDIVRVPEGSRLTVEYSDGASIALVGPAALRFGQNDSQGRRVVLGSGAVSEAVVRGIALEIQAPDPYDASLVLQNARGFARVSPGDRIVFQKFEGEFAKVWRDNRYTELGKAAWQLNIRDGSVAGGRGARLREEMVGNDVARILLGGVTIVFYPASMFSRDWLGDGGLRLTFVGPEDRWGQVDVGNETTLYVTRGESVEFNGDGDIMRFDGVSHMYRPLSDPLPTDDPIENAADASPSFSRKR